MVAFSKGLYRRLLDAFQFLGDVSPLISLMEVKRLQGTETRHVAYDTALSHPGHGNSENLQHTSCMALWMAMPIYSRVHRFDF